jgi:CelD/BcsL family acetyltransferase involved in cellulose biosynthesis
MISIQVLEGLAAISALGGEWDELARDSAAAAFAGHSWYLAWADVYHPKRIAVVTARDGARLVGVLALARIQTDWKGLYSKLVVPFALGDYQPFLVDPARVETLLPMLLDAGVAHYGRRGVYWWPHIPATDPALETLRRYLDARRMPHVEEREAAPRLRIDGADFATIEKGWASSHRVDARRQRKRLAEQGSVSLWQPATIEEAEAVLEEFFEVHDRKWLAQGSPGVFQNSLVRAHFQAIMRRLWGRGWHFSTIRCGTTNVSYHFGFLSGGWLLWYRPSYRPEFGRFSPSKIHVAMLIEEGCRAGWKGFDFLLGEEPYKLQWSNERAEVVNIHAGFHRWAPSYFWFAKGRPLMRQRFAGYLMRARAWWQKRRGAGAPDGKPE